MAQPPARECRAGSSHGLPAQGGSPCLAGVIGITPGKILITVASKVPPVTAVAGPAQEVQIICIVGILVTPVGELGHLTPQLLLRSVWQNHFPEPCES